MTLGWMVLPNAEGTLIRTNSLLHGGKNLLGEGLAEVLQKLLHGYTLLTGVLLMKLKNLRPSKTGASLQKGYLLVQLLRIR